MAINGTHSTDHFHRELGKIMWEHAGMARTEAGLKEGLEMLAKLKAEFWKDVKVPGSAKGVNPELEKALRLADFFDMGELIMRDALNRNESCGGHFREEYQTEEGEAMRNDEDYMYVSAWKYKGEGVEPELYKEPLKYEIIEVKTRNYKTS